jgi:hypothetical protein
MAQSGLNAALAHPCEPRDRRDARIGAPAVIVRVIREHEQNEKITLPCCGRFVKRPAHQPDAHEGHRAVVIL